MTFYLDASIQKAVRTAIAGVREDVLYAGGPNAPAEGTKDHLWLPTAGANDWVVLMRDKMIRKRPGERRALINAGVRAFCFTDAGNATRWRVLELIVRRWTRIATTAEQEQGPYIYGVTLTTFARLALS